MRNEHGADDHSPDEIELGTDQQVIATDATSITMIIAILMRLRHG